MADDRINIPEPQDPDIEDKENTVPVESELTEDTEIGRAHV